MRALYHATNAINLPAILEHGITPRAERPSRWKKAPSRHDRVYLTAIFGFYFAAAAVTQEHQTSVILEIDASELEPELLRPDEDALVQLLQAAGIVQEHEMHHIASNEDFSEVNHLWSDALRLLGNVAYEGPIPPEAIRRVATIEWTNRLYKRALQPKVTIETATSIGGYLRRLCYWIFDPDLYPFRDDLGESPLHPNERRVDVLERLHHEHITVESLSRAQERIRTHE